MSIDDCGSTRTPGVSVATRNWRTASSHRATTRSRSLWSPASTRSFTPSRRKPVSVGVAVSAAFIGAHGYLARRRPSSRLSRRKPGIRLHPCGFRVPRRARRALCSPGAEAPARQSCPPVLPQGRGRRRRLPKRNRRRALLEPEGSSSRARRRAATNRDRRRCQPREVRAADSAMLPSPGTTVSSRRRAEPRGFGVGHGVIS